MLIRHRGVRPLIDPTAYVAPTATLIGAIHIGASSRVLHGAILTAEGGPLEVGRCCVIMENAVVRSSERFPTRLGNYVLVGPHAHLSGCELEDEVFIAPGAAVFNGGRMARASSIGVGSVVHVGACVAPGERVPIGCVAVGNPARFFPQSDSDSIRTGIAGEQGGFLPFVFGVDPAPDGGKAMQDALTRYSAALGEHLEDELI